MPEIRPFIPLNEVRENGYLRIGISNSDPENGYKLPSFLARKKGGKVVENNKVTIIPAET